jgi:hypothetical protein
MSMALLVALLCVSRLQYGQAHAGPDDPSYKLLDVAMANRNTAEADKASPSGNDTSTSNDTMPEPADEPAEQPADESADGSPGRRLLSNLLGVWPSYAAKPSTGAVANRQRRKLT